MAFSLHLQESLRYRGSQAAREFAAGDSLETVLGRHLVAVEASAHTDLLTSILLLDRQGKRLHHAAAPSLPREYCDAIDGTEIGPAVGSCGTAAFLGRPIYVTDIETDPLWQDFRDLALPHGLRACWSTPIRDDEGAVIGTFAIYHLTRRSPTPDEVEAIRLITDHVAEAIICAGSRPNRRAVHLRLIGSSDGPASPTGTDKSKFLSRLRAHAAKLDRFAGLVDSEEMKRALRDAARDCRKLIGRLEGDQGPSDLSQ